MASSYHARVLAFVLVPVLVGLSMLAQRPVARLLGVREGFWPLAPMPAAVPLGVQVKVRATPVVGAAAPTPRWAAAMLLIPLAASLWAQLVLEAVRLMLFRPANDRT